MRKYIFILAYFLLVQTLLQAQCFMPDETFGNHSIKMAVPTLSETYSYTEFYHDADNKRIYNIGFFPSTAFYLKSNFIYRTDYDGKLDLTYGVKGWCYFGYKNIDENLAQSAVVLDGAVYCVGFFTQNSSMNKEVVVTKISNKGFVDSAFGNQGTLHLNPGFKDMDGLTGIDINLRDSNKLLITTLVNGINWPNYRYYLIMQIDTNGNMDSSFAKNGISMLQAGKDSESNQLFNIYYGISIDEKGFTLVGKESQTFGGFTFARFKNNGAIDSSYGRKGTTMPVYAVGGARSIYEKLYYHKDANNIPKLYISQLSDDGMGGVFAITRFHSNGLMDSSFGKDGSVLIYCEDHHTSPGPLKFSNGNIIAVGWATSSSADSGTTFIQCIPENYTYKIWNSDQPINSLKYQNYTISTLGKNSTLLLHDSLLYIAGDSGLGWNGSSYQSAPEIIRYKLNPYYTSVSVVQKQIQLLCYPNPIGKGQNLKIKWPVELGEGVCNFSLHSLSNGTEICHQQISAATNNEIKWETDLVPGMYVLRVSGKGFNGYTKLLVMP